MANINILGNAAVVTSRFKTEDIEKLKKYKPSALTLLDEKENPIFLVTTGDVASVNANGIVFNGTARDGSGYATATFDIGNVEDAEKFVMDQVGFSILRLNELEELLGGHLDDVNEKLDTVMGSIHIIGSDHSEQE